MWQHEILWDAIRYGYRNNPICKQAYDLISEAEVFHVGHTSKIIAASGKRNGEIVTLDRQLPYPVMGVEMTLNDLNENGAISDVFCLLAESTSEYPLGAAWCFAKSHEKGKTKWICLPYVNRRLSDIDWQVQELGARFPNREVQQGAVEYNSFIISVVQCLLDVLKVKNLVIKELTPTKRMNAQLKREHRPTLRRYKILEIVRGIPEKRYEAVPYDYKSPREMAFHLVRGHFKTYTEDRPLFGKLTGTFWWQPAARGTTDFGVIDKDYSIATN